MTIAARIDSVQYQWDGTATLGLIPIPDSNELMGQSELIVLNPPPRPQLESAIGCDIRTDRDTITVGGRKWAERVRYRSIRLVERVEVCEEI